MPLYEYTNDSFKALERTSFEKEKILEREDLQQRILKDLSIIEPGLFFICEEFGQWEGSYRQIDILALDKSANLVVIELKRTNDGGHMELQALRYAAMVDTMTFEDVVSAHANHLGGDNCRGEARQALLDFLGREEPDEESFANDVRIFLVSADFSKEITATVLWLNKRNLDIRCLRMQPYTYEGRVLVDVQRIIPLPEAEEYQVKVKAKEQQRRKANSLNLSMEEVRGRIESMPEHHQEIIRNVEEALLDFGYKPCPTKDGLAWRFVGVTKKCIFVKFMPENKNKELSLWFQQLTKYPPFNTDEMRQSLYEKFSAISTLRLTPEQLDKNPDFALDNIDSHDNLQMLLNALRWVAKNTNDYFEKTS